MKIYTKTGDDGTTGIQGGTRISKSSTRIQAYGNVDEINSVIGIVLSNDLDEDISKILVKIQNELFVLGSDLSNANLNEQKNRINSIMVKGLESDIDILESELPPITNFILPGGTPESSYVHLARTISRRAETLVVGLSKEEKINESCIQYLNRLSDLLFVIARVLNKRKNVKDVIWKP